MRVAVLIPVYNAERYLRECLDSVLAQGVDVFCCDDGSKDASLAMLMEYSLLYPRQFHFVSQANRGVVATRNRLMDELPEEYEAFAFVDSDDTVAPGMYDALADALVTHGADVAESGMPGNTVSEEMVIDDMSVYWLRRTAPGAWINVVNKLYRREAVKGIRFREGLRFEEDFFFNYEVHAAVRRKAIIPEIYYTYRSNPESATNALNFRNYLASASERIRLMIETFLRPGRIPAAVEGEWRAELAKDAYRMCLRKNLKKNRNAEERRELFLAAGEFFRGLDGFDPSGLNPVQRLLFDFALAGRYRMARILAYLT